MVCKVSVAKLYFVENNKEGVSFKFQSLSLQTYFSHVATDTNPNLIAVLEPGFLNKQKKQCVIQTDKE